jgi:hypothetical protein
MSQPHSNARATASDFERTYGFPRAWITALNVFAYVFVIAGGWGLAFQETHRFTFRLMTAEHGPVELGSAIAWLVACILSARLALRAQRHGESKLVVLAYAAFAFAAFMAMGEEISWGQALFYYNTPFGLRNVNEQGEFNVHNLPGVMELNSVFLLAYGIAGLVGIRVRRVSALRKIAVPSALAPLFVWITIMGALASIVDFFLIQYTFDMIVGVLTEAVEMLMGFAAVAYIAMNTRMLEREWHAAGAGVPRADTVSASR